MNDDMKEFKKQVEKRIEQLNKPIDFETLISNGLLEKSEEEWYVVSDLDKLPDHVKGQIGKMEQKEQLRVKFNMKKKGRKKITVAIKALK